MTLGADPEVFLQKDGILLSSIGLVDGTKEMPHPLNNDGYYIQKDNILAEFNIPPAFNRIEWLDYIKKGLDLTTTYLAEKGVKPLISSYQLVEDETLLNHPDAKRFGCEPDILVWDDAERCIKASGNKRSAGGHVHIGYENVSDEMGKRVIKACDLFLGLPSIILDPVIERRAMYGGAGCYRNKYYGVEYRTLSNFWLKSDELIEWVWDNSQRALEFAKEGIEIDMNSEGQLIPDAINHSNLDLVKYFIDKYNVKLPKDVKITA
jgi:hypothetical protein